MNRNEIIRELASDMVNGVCVEIGTHKGEFAEEILKTFPTCTLYCIDPYCSYPEYDDTINKFTGDAIYIDTSMRLKELYGDRVHFIREFSSKAVSMIPDQIDFLYIDGNHSYPFVKQDLELYYPKMKSNRYILGDDAVDLDGIPRNAVGDILVEWVSGAYGYYGVIKAFREFTAKNNLYGSLIGNQYLVCIGSLETGFELPSFSVAGSKQ